MACRRVEIGYRTTVCGKRRTRESTLIERGGSIVGFLSTGDATESSGSIWSGNGACFFNYGKRLAIYIHLQQTLICCTACLQAPSILGCSIDISGCSTIVSYIRHPAKPLETRVIAQ